MKLVSLFLAGAFCLLGQSINGIPSQSITSLPTASLPSSSGFGLFPVQVCHAEYSFATDGGATGTITPANNCTLPAKAIMFGSLVDWTTPGVGALNTTSIGTTGTGSSTSSVMPSTAVASLTGLVTGLVTFASPVKITTSGTVTVTIATTALSAGICEIYIFFVVSPT